MSNAIKKITDQFIKQHCITVVDYSTLKDVVKKIGYTIIEFNNIVNDKNVETVIQNLELSDIMLQSRGFTYVSNDHRLIFINEDLNDEEKLLVLSHELGHIVCKHFATGSFIGKDVKEEHEANEFSHYLLANNFLRNAKNTLSKCRKLITAVILLLIVILATVIIGFSVNKKQSYYGDYYITATGNKYHKKNCIFIKHKTNVDRITQKEFDSGKFEACEICLSGEN